MDERIKRLVAEAKRRMEAGKEAEKAAATPSPVPGTVVSPETDEQVLSIVAEVMKAMDSPEYKQNKTQRNGGFSEDNPGDPTDTKLYQYDLDAADFDPSNIFSPAAKVYGLGRQQLAGIHTPVEVELIEQFKSMNDAAYLAGHVKAFRLKKNFSDVVGTTEAYKQLQQMLSRSPELRKAMAVGNTAQGAEWVPTGFSSQLLELIDLELMVAQQFQSINMPTNPYKFPVETGESDGYLVAESTSDTPNKIPANTPATGDFTFSAKKLASRTRFSEELNEDSIISVMPFAQSRLAKGLASALENAILNGDIAATHQDADVTAATDPRKAFKGLRYKALNNAGTATLAITAPSATLLNSLRALMGKYGVFPSNLFYTISPKTYYKFLAMTEVRTVDKYGPNATVLKGELGRFDNIPILVSEYVRENLNAAGVNEDGGTNTKTVIHLTDKRGFWIGRRSGVTIASWKDIETDQMAVVAKTRVDFKDPYDAEDANHIQAVMGYNTTV